MPIDYETIMSLKSEGEAFSYSDRETMLYALGVGFGRDPMEARELPFIYEGDLRTVPSLATVIAWGAGPLRESGINFMMVVHGEQRLKLHRPLPPAGDITADSRVVGAYDKGEGKGAIILTETEIALQSGEKLCTLGSTVFARGDGGFGGPKEGNPPPHPIPDRKPDHQLEAQTRIDQAVLYRLSGDRNPLHIDPAFAKAAGFDKPILHGLCSYGTACRALLQNLCDYDHKKITQLDVRFSAPVMPGETLAFDVWEDGKNLSFTARAKERNVLALNNGKCVLS